LVQHHLNKDGFTYQKVAVHAIQQDTVKHYDNILMLMCQCIKEIVSIDETGSNLQDTTRTHGYSMKEKSLKAQKFMVKGEHTYIYHCCHVNAMPSFHRTELYQHYSISNTLRWQQCRYKGTEF